MLIVDDDPVAAREVRTALVDLGYAVKVACAWTDALRQFDSDSVDLVLMDAVMPTVDGFKLTSVLRARMRSYVPVVLLTGLADASAREHGLAAGADDFLCKPVKLVELRLRMAAMLRIRQLTKVLEAKSKELERLAHLDALTGIANRRGLEECLAREVERANRYGRDLSLIMFDLDHFKQVNDCHGHLVGDALLSFFGQVLEQMARTCDMVFRYGGEEFVVLAPDTAAARARNVAERICRGFELQSPDASVAGPQTVSAGVCDLKRLDVCTVAGLLECADTALYDAKKSGRNRVAIYGEGRLKIAS